MHGRRSERFLDGAVEKGYTKRTPQKVFDLIEPFAGYAFNKAHSYSYGTIAYQTAWLKANYPEEYLTAVLQGAAATRPARLERIGGATASACGSGSRSCRRT